MIDADTMESLMKLPPSERLALAERLWSSLSSDETAVPVPEWHREVVEQRMAEDDKNASAAESWQSVRRRIENQM